jgi:hypothetical protein
MKLVTKRGDKSAACSIQNILPVSVIATLWSRRDFHLSARRRHLLKRFNLICPTGASHRGNARVCAVVIACDKREAFAQGSTCDEAIHLLSRAAPWIASLCLGRTAPRECGSVSRRHCEGPLRRSNPSFASPSCKMDCFASLAMTAERARHTLARHHPRRRVIQDSRDVDDGIERPRRTGSSGQAGR